MNIVLLLTACVNPNGMSHTVLTDCSERQSQYEQALRWYLENTNFKIVLCENSQTDFSANFNSYINEDRLEFLCFDGNNFDKELGKGYGEGIIQKYALTESKFIAESDFVIKITGRRIIENLNSIVSKILFLKKILSTDNIISLDIIHSIRFARSGLIFAPRSFYTYFSNNCHYVNDGKGTYFEHVLYTCLKNIHNNLNWKILQLPLPIRSVYVSGTTGEVVKFSIFSDIKYLIKFWYLLVFNNHFFKK